MSTLDSTHLPRGWVRTTIGTIAEILTGNTPPTANKSLYGGDIPFIKPPQLLDRPIGNSADGLSPAGCKVARTVPADTTLVSCIGILGKTGLTVELSAFNQQINAAQFHREIDPRFGFYQCQCLRPYLHDVSSATTVRIVNKKKFCRASILVAPLCEQHRIVAEIEKQFSRLDAGVAALKRVEANLKRYKAAVLKAACTGELTADWRAAHPDVEPASKLLDRILRERRQKWEEAELAKMIANGKPPKDDKWKAKYKEPVAPQRIGMPNLPYSWCWATVDQLIWYLRNGLSQKPVGESGLRVLRISAVRPMKVDLSDTRYFDLPPNGYEDYAVAAGDLLFTRYNGSRDFCGVCGVVPPHKGITLHPDKLIRVRVMEDLVSPQYLEVVINVGSTREHISRKLKTTAGQVGISGSDIRSAPIPLAPLEEQQTILEEAGQALARIEGLRGASNRAIIRGQRLRQSILNSAFEGKLVDQDPSDEPASVLLERIRAERERREPEDKARRKASPEKKRKIKKKTRQTAGGKR